MSDQTIEWLCGLAEKGGKGTVDNIDARSLGRIADALAAKDAEIVRLQSHLKAIRSEIEQSWRRVQAALSGNTQQRGD